MWHLGLFPFFNKKVRKRAPFSHERVVSGWGIKGAGLPHFASRLYQEVKLLRKALAGYSFGKSLEIGCGYGRLTPWIMEFSNEHYAVEPEEQLLTDAMKLNSQVHFYDAKAQRLPFPDEHFDLIVTWTVLQHIPPKEQIKAINEIKRVAKPSAVLLIAEGTGTFQDDRDWFRPIEDWTELFKPWGLVKKFDRVLEATAGKNNGTIMLFKRS